MKKIYLVFIVLSLIFLSGCNVFDFTHVDGENNDVNITLGNADAAQKSGDYATAASLYLSVINDEGVTINSRARVGYASAILFRDIVIADVPKLMVAIFNVDVNNTNTQFLDDVDIPAGLTVNQYKLQIAIAVSNSAYFRSPVLGINPDTAVLTTNSSGEPYAPNSDGYYAADDRNVLLNYLIIKGVHVGLTVQAKFQVVGSMAASIDVNSYTNGMFEASTNQQNFTNFHISFTNDITTLMQTYTDLTNVILAVDNNTSILNMIDAVDALVVVLSNDGISQDTINLASTIKDAFIGLVDTLTNGSLGIQDGFTQLTNIWTNLNNYAMYTNVPAFGKTGGNLNWLGY